MSGGYEAVNYERGIPGVLGSRFSRYIDYDVYAGKILFIVIFTRINT